ncbi:MAG: lipopolysaccharide biosynthesis protein [Qipengyuania sp.]
MTGGEIESDAQASQGFATRVRSALAWRYGSQIAAQVITWGSTLIVVRILDPSDYGLFAMSQVVLAALNFLNGYGFASSLVRQPQVGEREIGQAFALLLLLNTGLAVTQWLIAPMAADYYNQPIIADMLRVQALLYFTTPFIALPSAVLARRIRFREQGVSSVVSAVSGAISALALAWYGYGLWALVYAPIIAFAVRAVTLMVAAGVWVRPVFDFRGAGAMIGFGGAMTLAQLFWIIQSQSDIFIAGRTFEAHELGLYAEALFLTLIVTGRFLPPLNDVAFPAYAELHQTGRSLAPYFERAMRSVALVTAPVYVGLSLTAPEAVYTLFGEKWMPMAPIVAGLSLVMPLMALQIVCAPATDATGQARIHVTTTMFGALAFVACFLFGVRYGPMGLVHAWWAAAPLLLIFTLALTMPKVGMRISGFLAALVPALVATGVMAATVLAVRATLPEWHSAWRLALLVAAGALAYGATLWFGWQGVVRDSLAMFRGSPPPLAARAPGDRRVELRGAPKP